MSSNEMRDNPNIPENNNRKPITNGQALVQMAFSMVATYAAFELIENISNTELFPGNYQLLASFAIAVATSD